MKLKAILAAAALLAAVACATGQQLPPPKAAAQGPDDVQALLVSGGNLIILRHATAPSGQASAVGMTSGCVLEGPRGLDAQGFAEARAIGEWLAANQVAISIVYTSDICRAYDTAVLVAAGRAPVIPRVELKTEDQQVADRFQAELARALSVDPAANIVLVSHSNITPLYGAGPLTGESETPSARLHVIRNGAVLRLDPGVEVAVNWAKVE